MADTNTSDNAISNMSLDLSAASAAAIQDLQVPAPAATPAEPEAVEAVAAEAEPVAPAAAPVTPDEEEPTLAASEDKEATEEAEPTAAELKKWSVRAGGKTLELTEAELIERAQMGVDYEQKTQKLAAERREAQQVFTELQKRQAQLTQIARDPQLFAQYQKALQQAYGLPDDPNEVVTAEQALRMTQLQLNEQMQVMQRQQEEREWEREVDSLTSDYEKQVIQHAAKLQSQFPILDSIDDLVDVLKLDVAKALASNPTDDIGKVTELMTAAARKRAEKLTGKINDHKKMEAVRAAKLKATKIDPPGGQGVRPTPTPQKFRLGDPALTAQATADLQEIFSKKR